MANWPFKKKLQTKASLIILLIVGGAMLTTEWLHQSYVAEVAKDAIHSKALVLLQQIETRFKTEQQFHLSTIREKYLKDLIERNPDLLFIQLYGTEEKMEHGPVLLTQVGKTELAKPQIPSMVLASMYTQETRGVFQSQAGDDRLLLSTPLNIRGHMVGILYAEYWTGHLNTITRFFLNWSLATRVIMGIGIMVALNLFLYIHVIRPLSRLKEGIAELEKGRWGTAIPIQKNDELGELARAFNTMAQNIQQMIKENEILNQNLIQARDTLQGKVAEATAELRQRNEELAGVNERLSAAQRDILRQQRLAVLGQLVATIAHKIGTPLTAISGHLQLLQEDQQLPHEVLDRVRTMLKQTDRLNHSLRDLLTFTRTPTLTFEPVSLQTLLEQCILLFRPLLQDHGIQWTLNFPPDLPLIQGDAFHLQEAINNIIDNAIDAMPHGGMLTIQAFHEPESDSASPDVCLTIHDTGIGLPQDTIERIFEPFFTTKSVGSGTGLGLAITTEIIQLHKGSITAASVEGQGTTFSLRL
ncbi:MAG: HAMP domain-containing protein, partial [Nitrospira sp.]|nr:HAMP domain-containing protein [Nitrospira sp.]